MAGQRLARRSLGHIMYGRQLSRKLSHIVVDKCSQPEKEAGSCYDYVLRYSYVSSSGDCEAFYYGGCEGNDNRFESAEECEAECMGAATTRRPPRQTDRPPVTVTQPDDSHQLGLLMYIICTLLIGYSATCKR